MKKDDGIKISHISLSHHLHDVSRSISKIANLLSTQLVPLEYVHFGVYYKRLNVSNKLLQLKVNRHTVDAIFFSWSISFSHTFCFFYLLFCCRVCRFFFSSFVTNLKKFAIGATNLPIHSCLSLRFFPHLSHSLPLACKLINTHPYVSIWNMRCRL